MRQIDLDLAEQQLRVLNQQESFTNLIMQSAGPLIDRFSGQLTGMDQYAQADQSRASDWSTMGGAATPEQRRLIAEATNNALASGQSDINQSLKEGLGLLRSELAPGLGLRPGDTPVLDRGGLLAKEALRQGSQLSLGLRSAQAQAELDYPFKASQELTALKDFQSSLQDSAFKNRLALTTTAAQVGLGLGQPTSANQMFNTEAQLSTRSARGTTHSFSTGGSASYGTG
jgi:hypothetical protein